MIKPLYYEDEWRLSGYDLDDLFNTSYFLLNKIDVLIEDHFSEHGIVPYHLEITLANLTKAFENKDKASILRISADFGHYISDAHVPLHTTTNYNGQLTDQVGIHAFLKKMLHDSGFSGTGRRTKNNCFARHYIVGLFCSMWLLMRSTSSGGACERGVST